MKANNKILKKRVIEIILAIFILFFFYPIILTILNSFKTTEDIIKFPFSFGPELSFDNYLYVLFNPNIKIFIMYKNTIVITGLAIIMILLAAPTAGYYIARQQNRILARRLTLLFLFGMMIPEQIVIIQIVKFFSKIGLSGSIGGLMFYYIAQYAPIAILMFSKYIRTIPEQLDEAAIMDGAGYFTIYLKVILPLLKPCLSTVIIFVGFWTWNDFLSPMLLLGGTGSKTITLGIYTAIGPYSADYGHVFTFVVIAVLPIMFIYLKMQKWIISGLTEGAIKG